MIITLPVSHLIDAENYRQVPGVKALEYKEVGPALTRELPSLLHSNLGIVQDAFIEWFDGIAHTLAKEHFRVFSFDCGPAAREVELEDYSYVAGSEVLSRGALKELMAHRLNHVRDRFSGRLAVENLNYYPTDAYRHVCEAGFINEVVRENEIGLVLDLAHAIVTAFNMGCEVLDYLLALPLDCVCGIHLSAPGVQDGSWRDLHGPPTQREYALLDRLLPLLPNDIFVAVEDYASLGCVVEDYAKLTRFLQERAVFRDGACHPTTL